ncbi:MAG: D-alanine--D-alanine ligase family protein [Mycobacterium sp.]
MTGPESPRPSLAGHGERVRVAVVFGGRSNEHPISCVSAGSILRNLDPQRFEVVAVGITPEGSWVLTDGDPDALAISNRQLPGVTVESGTELALPADPRRGGELVSLEPGAGEVLTSVDVVFPVLHGPYGEDGTIQGLLELAGVPYVGAGVLASAAGMDKEFTKKLLAAEGLPVGPHAVLRPSQPTLSLEECERLGLPAFVKPARGGSSIGVSRVSSWDELPAAIAEARRHDPKVIVEAAINGRELECGVLEMPDGAIEASTVGEIRVAGVRDREDAFYDFATKYLDDAAELDVPAKIDDDVADAIRQLAIRAFRAIDCQGLARVDFFLTDDGPVINEINTMPGFTTISMYPRMWAASGVDYPTLLATMVETAVARGVGLR